MKVEQELMLKGNMVDKSGDMENVLVAIPAYNEELAIGSVVLNARKYVDYVVVVDDGSTDKTAEIAEFAGAEVIRHEKNEGKGVALKTAFNRAKELCVDVLVCLDGDGQHNPDDIPRLVNAVVSGVDVVIGSRFLDSQNSVPKYRRIGQEILTYLTNSASKDKIKDTQCGFRAYSKNAIELLDFKETGIGIESEIQVLAGDLNLSIKEIPISCKYGNGIKSTYNPVYHGYTVINTLLRFIGQRRPLLFFSVPGVVFMIAGFLLGMRVLDTYSTTQQFAIGTALMTLLFTLGGMLSAFTGIILHSVASYIRNGKNY